MTTAVVQCQNAFNLKKAPAAVFVVAVVLVRLSLSTVVSCACV